MKIDQVYTPAILLNLDYMEHNLKKYADLAAAHGKQIWPMVKTHKSTELALLQQQYGCTGFCAARWTKRKPSAQQVSKTSCMLIP